VRTTAELDLFGRVAGAARPVVHVVKLEERAFLRNIGRTVFVRVEVGSERAQIETKLVEHR